ncbi:4-hydroxyphenylacetate decarboxylase small subunit [Anaeromicrobium sediminis]|uniref:4-hydroxyphenylacetate decarboxylase small subunit n=1 Tax=Anaeromicrobium sediminis TaxID=1478221 RepID=A0A267ME63_9FIRM|nr:4-hydroxyphenylacetate decarboxylase small subunit [Anaeromicrobium sediminis]PAB57849.1 MFS transporter [Anaeromicrobium sediminis]
METKKFNHSDCLNFATIDVAKGFCRVTNEVILTDTDICPKFSQSSKCKNCAHFSNPNEDNIGTCSGLEDRSWTYGDLNAITCNGYEKI